MLRDIQLTVAGNVGGTIDLRFTPNGKAVASFSVAHTPQRPDGNGGWTQGETTWLRTEVWGPAAENLANSANVDRARVVVIGRLVTEKWTDKSGEERTGQKLIAEEVSVSVTYATVDVRKATRRAGDPDPVDPWTGEAATAARAPGGAR